MKGRSMVFILLGMTSFAFILVQDWASCRRARIPQIIALALAALTLASSAAILIASPGRIGLPLWAKTAGWALSLAFLSLLVLSLCLEVSFAGSEEGVRVLNDSGTYALVRHPGVIWFFFFHLSLALATGSALLLASVPCWTGANLILAAVEDRVFFPRLFGAPYLAYKRSVPFLVPNGGSIRKCLATLRLSRRNMWKR
jgi:protein-S-isoprenylcysteine O-methyltransferase Ste14